MKLLKLITLLFIFQSLSGCYKTGYVYYNNNPHEKRILVGKGSSRPFYYGLDFSYNECIEQQLLFKEFGFKNGEIIGDIGASSGYMEGAFSVFCDSITFYIEDINKSYLNDKELNKVINYFTVLRGKPQTNKFNLVIGDIDKTHLPNGIFDKLITISSFHEFYYVDSMVTDFYKKLKLSGVLIISDEFSSNSKINIHNCGVEAYKVQDVLDILKKHGLYLTKMSAPENCKYNNLFFEKNQNKSENYYNKRKLLLGLDSVLNQISLLELDSIVNDTIKLKNIETDLFNHKDEFLKEYIYIDSWINNIAFEWFLKGNLQQAIRVYKISLSLFPMSAINHNNLADAYIDNKQYKLALINIKKALEIDTSNVNYKTKYKNLEEYIKKKKIK